MSLFFVFLVLFFSTGYYSFASSALTTGTIDKEETLSFVEDTPVQFFFIQEKSSSPESQGWKTFSVIPGLSLIDILAGEAPGLTEIRKFFVVDFDSYSPGKPLLLFPFHEFL